MNDQTVDFQLKLQEPSFKIPFESMRKNFKAVQKLDEKQFKKFETDFRARLGKCSTRTEQIKVLRLMISNFKAFERKLQARIKAEDELVERIEARISKFSQLKDIKSDFSEDKLLNWYRNETNLLVIDYLLRNNRDLALVDKISAEDDFFTKLHPNYKKLIDYDILLTANRIANSITLNRDLGELVSWITDNKSFLKKIKSNLEFETRLQQFIELIVAKDFAGALKAFKQHLTPFTHTNFNEIKLASGLLIFSEKLNPSSPHHANSSFSQYRKLLSASRYNYLSDLFLNIYYKMYGIPKNDPLLIYLSIGISSLKTHQCLVDVNITDFNELLSKKLSNVESTSCPICSLEMNQLAKNFPYSHNIKSYLFDNPVMLPNGNIFDKFKLLRFSEIYDNVEVKDPITSEEFSYSQMVTMFPT